MDSTDRLLAVLFVTLGTVLAVGIVCGTIAQMKGQ
jgi:hypothetical protein